MTGTPGTTQSGADLHARIRAEVSVVQEVWTLARFGQSSELNTQRILERVQHLCDETRRYVQAVLASHAATGSLPSLQQMVTQLPNFSIWHWLYEATSGLSTEAVTVVQQEILDHYACALEQTSEALPAHRRQHEAISTLGATAVARKRFRRLYATVQDEEWARERARTLYSLVAVYLAVWAIDMAVAAGFWPLAVLSGALGVTMGLLQWRARQRLESGLPVDALKKIMWVQLLCGVQFMILALLLAARHSGHLLYLLGPILFVSFMFKDAVVAWLLHRRFQRSLHGRRGTIEVNS